MHKKPVNIDERQENIFLRICAVLYFITLFSLMGMQLYRQFVLHQTNQEWDDIAILITFNVLVLLGAVLYLSGVLNPKKIKLGYLVAGFVGFVLLGFAFTIFKYSVLLDQQLNLNDILDNLFIVIVISGLIALALGLLVYLGNRRIEKQLE